LSEVALRVALALAMLAAVIVILGVFPAAVRIVCLGVMVAATVAVAPARKAVGGGWWFVLVAGVLLSIGGAIVAQPSVSLGGLMALIGGFVVVVGAALGLPSEE